MVTKWLGNMPAELFKVHAIPYFELDPLVRVLVGRVRPESGQSSYKREAGLEMELFGNQTRDRKLIQIN